jgi:hypothetical protein
MKLLGGLGLLAKRGLANATGLFDRRYRPPAGDGDRAPTCTGALRLDSWSGGLGERTRKRWDGETRRWTSSRRPEPA